MSEISTLVFFDIETTGLPFQEKNQTKIIEASFVAANRKDIEGTPFGYTPPIRKLTFLLNPQRPIQPEVAKLTGLTNKLVRQAPVFKDKFSSISSFLNSLPKPVCLVAHNGNTFDYKILLAECLDANVSLPNDLYCLDSLIGFRRLLKGTTIGYQSLKTSLVEDDLMTDDEDEEWPDLNVTAEDWDEIDDLCVSFSDMSSDEPTETKQSKCDKKKILKKENKISKNRNDVIKSVFSKKTSNEQKETFKLSDIYKRLLNRATVNAHRAEADCLMLLECVVAFKDFLPWADEACKFLTEITPLTRYSNKWPDRF